VRDDGDIVDLQYDRRQHSDHAVRKDAALHEDRGETGYEPAKSGIPQHHLAIARPVDYLPISVHVIHALAYLVAV